MKFLKVILNALLVGAVILCTWLMLRILVFQKLFALIDSGLLLFSTTIYNTAKVIRKRLVNHIQLNHLLLQVH